MNLSGNKFGSTNPRPPANPLVGSSTNPSSSSVLPGVGNMNYGSFGSGSYTNPQDTTDSNANDNSNTIQPYLFMEDENLNKDMGEHKNKFGFNKRNRASIQSRIDEATEQGKDAKVARLNKKLANYNKNQQARAEGNLLDKINPKNWL